MRHRVAMTDSMALATLGEQAMAAAISSAMRRGTELLKEDWRSQIESAGLGTKLAKTVQGRTYPTGSDSRDPATWVFTKAPAIIDAFDRGPVILPTNGRFYLAVPTLNVPRKGRRRLTPVEVEAMYNQDLIIKPGRNGNLYAFVDTQGATWLRNQGKAYGTKGALKGYGPRPKRGRPILKLMFTLVRQTRLRKRLDLDAIASRAAARYPGLLTQAWLAIPERTARMKGL